MKPNQGQIRPVIREIYPSIDDGMTPIKRVVGEEVDVWADVICDGHDVLNAGLEFKKEGKRSWRRVTATHIGEDRWHATFRVDEQGYYEYRFLAWVDYALTWQHGIRLKINDGQDVSLELLEGLSFLEELESQVGKRDLAFIQQSNDSFKTNSEDATNLASSARLELLFRKFPFKKFVAKTEKNYPVYVDRYKANFSTWYEFFPRSSSTKKGVHGTFKDCERLLPRIKEFGFDTLYFPPIHPIGEVNRKGKNNNPKATKGDDGSCWGIGSRHGGHMAIHPELGDIDSFKSLVQKAGKLNIEIAMDLAWQCAPDHPWVKEHPDWFKQRPDGSIQYAENPPKKYQDIYPIYFETEDWQNLWDALKEVTLYWVEQGIRIFRVDNPHTKPILFWKWLITEVKKINSNIIFLSEAFTTPKLMMELAKVGFTQSYTYFTWRNNKEELVQYMTELTEGPTSEVFRPNFWPNTPDINPYALQNQNESVYLQRYFLAATLSSNVGVYGPAFELMDHRSIPGREEYLNSEKFEVRTWDWIKRNRITKMMSLVNQARKEIFALQATNNIQFCHVENPNILAYLKTGSDGSRVLVVVNLDPEHVQSGEVNVPSDWLGTEPGQSIKLTDRMTQESYEWKGENHFIKLEPSWPFHLFLIDS